MVIGDVPISYFHFVMLLGLLCISY